MRSMKDWIERIKYLIDVGLNAESAAAWIEALSKRDQNPKRAAELLHYIAASKCYSKAYETPRDLPN